MAIIDCTDNNYQIVIGLGLLGSAPEHDAFAESATPQSTLTVIQYIEDWRAVMDALSNLPLLSPSEFKIACERLLSEASTAQNTFWSFAEVKETLVSIYRVSDISIDN